MAGQWGYYAVSTQNGQTGIVAVAAGKKPLKVAGSAVAHATYLGDTNTPAASMTSYLHQFASMYAPGLFEAPGGLGGAIATARHNVSQGVTGQASAVYWQKRTPSGAVWDWEPTAVVATVAAAVAVPFTIGAGAAADVAGAEAAGGAAAGAGGAEAAAAGAGGGAAATAAKNVASTIAGNAGKIAGGLTLAGLFTDVGWWKGAAMCLAGAILIILALRQLA